MTKSVPLQIRTRGLRRTDWPVLVELMGPNGVGGGCWCQWWRVAHGGKTWEACKGSPAKRAFRTEVETGTVHGSLAFVSDESCGWCRYGPIAQFPRLMNSPSLFRDPPPGTWSITCFYIPARFRGRGVATALLGHALEVMTKKNVPCIEAYPVADRTAAGERPSAGFAWTGVEAMFKACGFRVAAKTRGQRRVWRRMDV